MGHRVSNNYDEASEEAYRSQLNRLPVHRRMLLGLRQLIILTGIIGFPAFLIARASGLL